MKRLATLAATILLTLAAGPAAAQYPGPSPYQGQFRPQLSPFLNLNRNSPAANYFNFVAPFVNAQPPAAATGYSPDVAQRRRPGVDEPDDYIPELPQTGHAVRFQNYGTYYNIGGGPRTNTLNPFPARPRR